MTDFKAIFNFLQMSNILNALKTKVLIFAGNFRICFENEFWRNAATEPHISPLAFSSSETYYNCAKRNLDSRRNK